MSYQLRLVRRSRRDYRPGSEPKPREQDRNPNGTQNMVHLRAALTRRVFRIGTQHLRPRPDVTTRPQHPTTPLMKATTGKRPRIVACAVIGRWDAESNLCPQRPTVLFFFYFFFFFFFSFRKCRAERPEMIYAPERSQPQRGPSTSFQAKFRTGAPATRDRNWW